MSKLKIIKQIKLQRVLTDSNFLDPKIEEDFFYEENSKKIIEIGLSREIGIDNINEIFVNAQDESKIKKFWGIKGEPGPKEYDGYVGIHLHNYLRLSRAEASRPELWNSIIYQNPEIIKYLEKRLNVGLKIEEKKKNLIKTNLFLQSSSYVHSLNRISGPWWVTEMTRNGKDYDSSKNAFQSTTYFYDRYITMNLMHYRQIAVGMANYFNEKEEARELLATRDQFENPQFSATLNDYMASTNFETKFKKIDINYINFNKWQLKAPSKNILNDGPDDFKITNAELKKVYTLFDELIKGRN